MTLTYDPDLNWVTANHLAEYLGHRSFYSKVIAPTYRQTHTHRTDRTTRTTNNVININNTDVVISMALSPWQSDCERSYAVRLTIADSATLKPSQPGCESTCGC